MRFNRSFLGLTHIIALCCVVFLLNTVTQGWINQFGLQPRQWHSLPAILWAPFLHANLWHLVNNLLGLALFGFLCRLRGYAFFWRNSFFIITVSGALVWLFGREAIHIGASGWIFGLWSLCIAQAWFERSLISFGIALFVVLFYSSMLWGVLPSSPHISFESHLFGALAGVLAASRHAPNKRNPKAQ